VACNCKNSGRRSAWMGDRKWFLMAAAPTVFNDAANGCHVSDFRHSHRHYSTIGLRLPGCDERCSGMATSHTSLIPPQSSPLPLRWLRIIFDSRVDWKPRPQSEKRAVVGSGIKTEWGQRAPPLWRERLLFWLARSSRNFHGGS